MTLVKNVNSKIFLCVIIISIIIGLFSVLQNALLTNNKNYQLTVENTRKINITASQNEQLLIRRQYQKEFNQAYRGNKLIDKNDIQNKDFYKLTKTPKTIKNVKTSKVSKVKVTTVLKHSNQSKPSQNKLAKNTNKLKSNREKIKKVTIEKNVVSLKKKKQRKSKNINITDYIKELQIVVNNLDETTQSKSKESIKNKPYKSTITKNSRKEDIDYWQTVYSIESKQGKLLYRPRNKARNCNYTLGPCGHHQLTVQALKDIGCNSLQCRKDRLDFNKSLQLSKKLLALNVKRLKKDGLVNLEGYQKYLIHQQGANGIKNIIAATKGKKELSKTIKKNMANNSPYSYKQYKRMGSKIAAKKFMQHWKKKWMNEKRMILASNTKSTKRQINLRAVPTFNDNDLNYALNLMF